MNKKKMKPLKYYLCDKEEMINQIFSCVSEKQINKMTPAVLHDMSIDELKAECLVQLLKMPNNTIINVLEGQKYFNDNAKKDNSTAKDVSNEQEDSTINNGQNNKNEGDTGAGKNETGSFDLKGSLGIKRRHKEKKHKTGKKKKTNDKGETEDSRSVGKNLLELLELEMRAKAIRSLLKQEEQQEKLIDQNKPSETMLIQKEQNNQSKLSIKDKSKKNIHKKFLQMKLLNPQISLRRTLKESKKRDKKAVETEKEDNEQPYTYQPAKRSDELELDTKEDKWATEDERLIYEDDEYDSDDKVDNTTNKEAEKSEESRSSWAERWLQSKDVKRVVATSKMLTVVRNKMRNTLKAVGTQQKAVSNLTSPLEMEGSVREYDTLHEMHESVLADAKINCTSFSTSSK